MTFQELEVNGGGRGRGHPNDAALATDLSRWLADLAAAEALRRRQLREIAELRSEIYKHARKQGVAPKVLRVLLRR